MDIFKYDKIRFYHTETGHHAVMKVKGNCCTYYYNDASPIWHMDVSHERTIETFESGEWTFVSGE